MYLIKRIRTGSTLFPLIIEVCIAPSGLVLWDIRSFHNRMPLWGSKKTKDSKDQLKLELLAAQAELAAALKIHEKESAETVNRIQSSASEARLLRAERAGLKARAAAVADERDRARAELSATARAKAKADAKA